MEIGGWVDGTIVRIIGTDSVNTVRVLFSDVAYGAVLNGNCTLQQYETLELVWNEGLLRWLEVSRSN